MAEYKPNSRKSKMEAEESQKPKKVEKVVTGKVVTKQKTVMSKVATSMAEDFKNVKSYVVADVLIPAFKKAVSDIVANGIDMLLYHGEGGRRSDSRRGASNYVSYNRYSDRGRRDDNYRSNNSTLSGYDYDDIILETRAEAEEVLRCMDEIMDEYEQVTVADLYDLVGKSGNYTDNKYGWRNIRNAEPIRVRDGYLLKMPKAIPVD